MVSEATEPAKYREPATTACADLELRAEDRRRELVRSLFTLYYTRVLSFARQASDPITAEDVSQEVFLRLLGHEGLEEKSITISYLLKVAHNLIRRRAQRHRRHEEFVRSEAEQVVRRARERRADRTEAQIVRRDIENLSDHEREAIRLIVCNDMSYEAAARSLDVSTTTINNWKFRGMQKLRGAAQRTRATRPGEDRLGGGDAQTLPPSPRRPGD